MFVLSVAFVVCGVVFGGGGVCVGVVRWLLCCGRVGWFVRPCVGGLEWCVSVWWVSRAAGRKRGVCQRCCGVCCLLCVLFAVWGLVVLRARVAHTLTHVGTVDDGRASGSKSPPPPLCLLCLLPLLCVGWWLLVVVCV